MLITVVLTLIVVGVLMWFVEHKIPMDSDYKRILQVLVLIVVVLWLVDIFLPGLLGFHFPHPYG